MKELPPLRLCERPKTEAERAEVRRRLLARANAWTAERRLIKEARERGLTIASPSQPSSASGFAPYLELNYLPWAKANLDPRTFEARRGTLMILAEDLGNTPLVQIEHRRDELVEKWRREGVRYTADVDRLGRKLNRKARDISDGGLNERLKILRAVLGHAHLVAKVLTVRSRIALVEKKRADPGAAEPVRFFSPEEKLRFLQYARPDMVDVFQIAVLTGMRPGELYHLRVGAVDLRAAKVWVKACECPMCAGGRWIPKTGRYRGIDIAPDLRPILRRLVKGRPDDALVIENQHGAPYSRLHGSGGLFVRTLRRAGLDRRGLSAYSTRHTFASDLVSAGKPMKEVADLLGNSVRVCEERYGKLQPGVTRETVKALRAVRPWPTTAPQGEPATTDEPRMTAKTEAA